MAAAVVNEATGEVTVELGGNIFRLRATMPRVAEYEAQLGVDGLAGIHKALQASNMKAVVEGLRCLCVSGNEAELEDLLLMPSLGPATAAIYSALTAGLPKGNSRGNARGPTERPARRRGTDTGNSPSA